MGPVCSTQQAGPLPRTVGPLLCASALSTPLTLPGGPVGRHPAEALPMPCRSGCPVGCLVAMGQGATWSKRIPHPAPSRHWTLPSAPAEPPAPASGARLGPIPLCAAPLMCHHHYRHPGLRSPGLSSILVLARPSHVSSSSPSCPDSRRQGCLVPLSGKPGHHPGLW